MNDSMSGCRRHVRSMNPRKRHSKGILLGTCSRVPVVCAQLYPEATRVKAPIRWGARAGAVAGRVVGWALVPAVVFGIVIVIATEASLVIEWVRP